MRLPIRARLTLVSALLMTVVLAGAGTFLYLRLRTDLQEAVDAGLEFRAETLVTTLESDGEEGDDLVGSEEAFAQILGSGGEVIDSSSGLGSLPVLSPAEVAGLESPHFFEKVITRNEGEQTSARFLAVRAPGALVLVVGASLDDQHEALTRLAILLAVGGPLALALATGVGWVVAGAALRPVEKMRAEAAAISASEPGRRLATPETGDELARLGETLNGMLERLEQALQRERRFVDEASHELRTPLANLRAELELALRRARTPDQLLAALRSAAEEAQRLTRLAEDLLVLARSDGGKLPVRKEHLDVAALIGETVGSFSSRADELGVGMEQALEPTRGRVDPIRVRQAIGNLIDNALRHSPQGGKVRVELDPRDGMFSIRVSDSGSGFTPSFLPRAFEAFSRADESRARAEGGTGLGLAIVRAVAEAHGGSVSAENRPDGGAIVTISLPT